MSEQNNLSPETKVCAICYTAINDWQCLSVTCDGVTIHNHASHDLCISNLRERKGELERLLRIANGAAIEMASLNESQARRLAELERENMCDACAGTGKPVSGIGCMCRGTGKMSEAARYLREQSVETKTPRIISEIDAICHAYETGHRQGLRRETLPNPYSEGSDEFRAYVVGHAEGLERPSPPPRPVIPNLAHVLIEQRGYGWSVVLCFHEKDDAQRAIQGFDVTGQRAAEPGTTQPEVPKGHYWRSPYDRFVCRNCGQTHDEHIHTDEASLCPRETTDG